MAKKVIKQPQAEVPSNKVLIRSNAPQKIVVQYVNSKGDKETLVLRSRESVEVEVNDSLLLSLKEYTKLNLITIKRK